MVDGAPHRDRVHPGRKFGVAPKSTNVPPRREPHLLTNVSRRVFVPDDRMNQAENGFIVGPHQHAERVLVARLRAA